MAEELLSRCNVLEGSTQVLAGESSPILVGPSSIYCLGLLPCDGIGFLSNCSGGFRVPLKLQQVTWGSFKIVEETPQAAWGSCSLIAIIRLTPVYLKYVVGYCIVFPMAQMVKHLPTIWETRVQSLGWEDLLEKEMATHSSILAWKIPWMEEPGRLQFMGSQRVRHD